MPPIQNTSCLIKLFRYGAGTETLYDVQRSNNSPISKHSVTGAMEKIPLKGQKVSDIYCGQFIEGEKDRNREREREGGSEREREILKGHL